MTASIETINPTELYELIDSGKQVDVIDVRTSAEFEEVHSTISRNVPLDSLNPHEIMAKRNGRRDEPLYLICASGARAKQAGAKFAAFGFQNIVTVAGGTTAWVAAGLSVVRGNKTISLERQVRITAGFFTLLGFFVHPYGFGLSAFVGIGLMYAGITDTCGMAMLLAKMPWNQKRANP